MTMHTLIYWPYHGAPVVAARPKPYQSDISGGAALAHNCKFGSRHCHGRINNNIRPLRTNPSKRTACPAAARCLPPRACHHSARALPRRPHLVSCPTAPISQPGHADELKEGRLPAR